MMHFRFVSLFPILLPSADDSKEAKLQKYLRSKRGQERLSNLAVLPIEAVIVSPTTGVVVKTLNSGRCPKCKAPGSGLPRGCRSNDLEFSAVFSRCFVNTR